VIGSRPDGWWRDRRGAMRRLVASLDVYARATREDVTVVFDGRPFPVDDAAVKVAFAPARGRGAADDAIVAAVDADADPASITVVTSDAELAERVRALGADVIAAGGFRRRLDELARD